MSQDNVETFVLEKNRISEKLCAGTRGASATVGFPYNDNHIAERQNAEQIGRQLAIEAYEARWGELPWDMVRIAHHHVTAQVVTELVVNESGDW